MAMYKVPVRVYETPSGKTLWVPTYMRMLSWFVMMPAAACIWVTIEFIFGGDSPFFCSSPWRLPPL